VTANLTASADVIRVDEGYRARLRVTSTAGFAERVIENERCDILADSVALVVALSASRAAAAAVRGDDTAGPRLSLAAHASAAQGLLPRAAPGVGGSLALEGVSALRLELSGTYYFEQTATVDQMAAGARFGLLRLGAHGCLLWALRPLHLGGCVGVQLYRIQGIGFGGVEQHTGASLDGGPAAGVFARLPLWKALSIQLSADGVVLMARQRFVLLNFGSLHRPSLLVFQLFIGPELRF
jgi:hypothetical protein